LGQTHLYKKEGEVTHQLLLAMCQFLYNFLIFVFIYVFFFVSFDSLFFLSSSLNPFVDLLRPGVDAIETTLNQN